MFKTEIQRYKAGDNITFNGILYDEGNYYNSVIHGFVCPKDGIYYAALNLMRNDFYRLVIDLMHQNTIIFHLLDSMNQYNFISNSAVIECLTGKYLQC